MKTNHNRIWEIGPRYKTQHPRGWRFLGQPENDTRIFLEESWDGIGKLGFGTVRLDSQARPPKIDIFQPYPPTEYAELLFCTSASLVNVETFRLCKKAEMVVGVLFEYRGSVERAVGQVRFDMLGGKERTTGTQGLAYVTSTTGRQVIDMRPQCHGEEKGQFLPWSGTLVWWFSAISCSLHHEKE